MKTKYILAFIFLSFSLQLKPSEKPFLSAEEQFLDICKKGDLSSIEKLLEQHPTININAKNKRERTALHIICAQYYYDKEKEKQACKIATMLIQKGANPNLQTKECGYTPLHYACIYNNTNSLVKTLINNEVDIHKTNESGHTALHIICYRMYHNEEKKRQACKIAKMLIQKGANPNIQTTEYGYTPLLYACIFNTDSLVEILINNKANINETNTTGHTALHMVCYQPYRDKEEKKQVCKIAEMLLQKGANPNIQNITDLTPLHYACKYNANSLIKILINNGANYAIKNEQFLSPYQMLSKPCITRAKFSSEPILFEPIYTALFDTSNQKNTLVTSLLPEIAHIIKNFYLNLCLNHYLNNMKPERWIWEPVCIEACAEAYKKDKIELDNVKNLQQCLARVLFWPKEKKLAINALLSKKNL